MIGAMPRPRPLHLHRERTRHGKFVWYVRTDKGPRIRVRAEYGTPEFEEAYQAALQGHTVDVRRKTKSGSLRWLYERYRESEPWRSLSPATRRLRENIFRHVMETAGSEPFVHVTRKSIEAGKDRRRAAPTQSRHFLDAMRGLFRWAYDSGHAKVDPTAGVKNPKLAPTTGFPVWTEEDVQRYEERWKVGTRQRVWLHVLLYTGLRRGDAVRLGRQHVRDNVAALRTEKSGFQTEVTLPILAPLVATLAKGPCGDLAFICGERGEPLTKESFGNLFRIACRAAGIRKSAHGVRKIGATRAANNGATEHQLMAIFGWTDPKTAAIYTRSANRRKLSQEAMQKMAGGTPSEHPMPVPDEKVRVAIGKPE